MSKDNLISPEQMLIRFLAAELAEASRKARLWDWLGLDEQEAEYSQGACDD